MTKPKTALIVVENNSVPFDIRVWQEATSLRDAGWTVSVICPSPPGMDTASLAKEDPVVDLDGIRVLYFTLRAASEGFTAYMQEYFTAFFTVSRLTWKVWRKEHFDVLQVCNPPDIFFPVMLLYRLLGAGIIYDHHDLFPEFVKHRFQGAAGRMLWWAAIVMEYLTSRASHITMAVNESYRDVAMQRAHLAPDRIAVVRNGPRINTFCPVPPEPKLKKAFPFLVCYIGIMGYEDGIPEMLEAIRFVVNDLGRRDILFHLMGDGGLRGWALEQVRSWKLDDCVEMPGMVKDRMAIQRYLSTADVCLSPEPPSPLNNKSTFIKVGEYMGMAKPVVAFDLKETRFTAGDAATYVRPGDIPAFGHAISDLIDSPARRAAMGKRGRDRFLECLGWEHQEKHLFDAYEAALQSARTH